MEKAVLTKIRKNIVAGDINIIDKDGHDLVFLSMVAGDENIALQLLENKYFDRTHLNRRENKTTKSREEEESLLATACYYACPKVAKILLEDEEFIKQVGKGLNPYQALVEPFYEVETKKENSQTVAKPYTIEEVEFIKELEKSLEVRLSIFNELLKHEDISFGMMEFIKIHDITRKKFAEWGSTKLVPFPYDTSKTKNFVTQILKKVIKTRKKSDWMSLDNWGDYTLPKYMLDANSTDLFYDMLKREDFDINQTREPSKMEYRRTLATYALKNYINPKNGRIYESKDEIFPGNLNLLYSVILDERFSARLTLDIINRLEYSNIKDKREIVKKIIITKRWPREEIYDETALACAFYQDVDSFTYLLNHPNIEISTVTLEIIHRYIEYYSDNIDRKVVLEITQLAEEALYNRSDSWNVKDQLAYALLFSKTKYLRQIDESLEKKIVSHFEEKEEIREGIDSFILPAEPKICSKVPEYRIAKFMTIIHPNESEVTRIRACYEKANEFLTKYHFVEENNLLETPEELPYQEVSEVTESTKKKTFFRKMQCLWKGKDRK